MRMQSWKYINNKEWSEYLVAYKATSFTICCLLCQRTESTGQKSVWHWKINKSYQMKSINHKTWTACSPHRVRTKLLKIPQTDRDFDINFTNFEEPSKWGNFWLTWIIKVPQFMYRYIQNMHLYFKLSQCNIENAENDNNVLCFAWYMNLTIVTSSLKSRAYEHVTTVYL
jgi:hypothetical protein